MTCCFVMPAGAASTSAERFGFCKSYTWLFGSWVAPPRLPLLADVNGDGYADFLYASPNEKLIDVSFNGHGLKPLRGQRFLQYLPQPILSMCKIQHFGKPATVFILGIDGALTRARADENGDYTATSLGSLAGVKGKRWLLAGRLISTDRDDLAVVSPNGGVCLVDSQTGKSICQFKLSGGAVAAVAGDIDGDGRAELALQTKADVVLYRLGKTAQKLTSLRCPSGQSALAMGDVNADGRADLLVNGCAFLGPDFKQSISLDGWKSFSKPVQAFLADINGDGRADVVVQHSGSDYYGSREADCNVYLAYCQNDLDWDDDGLSNVEETELRTDPLDRDTDYDGLLDGWEVHGFGGQDLAAMGASPLHKDVFVMNVLQNGSSRGEIEQHMQDTVVPFFAKLPYKNPDGTLGFAIHFTVVPLVQAKQTIGQGWEQLADELFPRDRIGSWHWMEITGTSGGGQSSLLDDVGSTGLDSWIHELGHQLGLTHSGKWGASSPTYTSLMNYAYCCQFNGQLANIHFSTGELAALVLNEQRLPERISLPYEKLKSLSSKPYEFRMRPLGPSETWIDWNWNGTLDGKPVKANISWGAGVDTGPLYNPSGRPTDVGGAFDDYTDFAPELIAHNGELYYLVVKRPPISSNDSRPRPGPLMMSRYQGNHSFGAATVIDTAVTNDPSAASDGKTLYVFYSTVKGVMYRFGHPDNLSKPIAVPQSAGFYVRAFAWRNTVYALFYAGTDKSIRYRPVKRGILGPVYDLGIKSTIPPGAVVDTIHHQLLLGAAQTKGNTSYRWQLHRFAWDDQAGGFKEVSREWLGGEKSGWCGSGRPSLIFDASSDAGPEGRIFFFCRGFKEQAMGLANVFIVQNVAYKDYNGGWLLKRIGDVSRQSRLTPGVAWFDGDIVTARTCGSDSPLTDGGVAISYKGLGITDVDMADFDDISLMADYGIARSIGTFAQMPPKGRKVN